jgi:Mrp family chromosome partitioning ATPase
LVLVVIVVLGGTYALYSTATRVYISQATFIVDQSPFQFSGNPDDASNADDSRLLLESIISSIQSEDMREIIAQRLNVPKTSVSFIGFDAKLQSLSTPDTVNIDASTEKASRVATIKAESSDPKFASLAANAVIDELSGLNRLAGRIDNLNEEIKVVQAKIEHSADKISASEADRVVLQQKILGLKAHSAAGGSLASDPAFADDEGLLELIKKKIDADAAYHAQAQVSVRGEQLEALEGQENSVNEQIDSYLHDREIGLASANHEAEQNVQVLQTALKDQTDLLSKLSSQKATLIEAIGDFKLRRSLGLFADNGTESEAGVIVTLDRAHPASRPSRPNSLLYSAIAIFLCGILASSLMFLRHNLDQRIRSPLQFEWAAGVHCLAVLAQGTRRPDGEVGNSENEPFSGLTYLRNQLLRQNAISGKGQIIAFTEIGPSHASEWVARLASLMAQSDRPTLLIDLDFQRPTLSKALSLSEGPGLYDWVKSLDPLATFISKSKVRNLGLIQAGTRSPDLDTFLARRPLAPHLVELQKDWPFIFIYGPSLVRSPSLLLAAPHDCTVIGLVQYNKSNLTDLREEISQCDSYHLRFAGVVLHHFPLKGGYRNSSRIGSHRYIYELKNKAAAT